MFARQKKLIRARAALMEVARQHGITLEEVHAEVSEAIREAMQTDDPVVKARWAKITKNGRQPSPEEFIVALWDMGVTESVF